MFYFVNLIKLNIQQTAAELPEACLFWEITASRADSSFLIFKGKLCLLQLKFMFLQKLNTVRVLVILPVAPVNEASL